MFGSQLALAAHQFEHAADDVEELCAVCLKLDSRDSDLANAAPSTVISAPAVSCVAGAHDFSPIAAVPGFSARASP